VTVSTCTISTFPFPHFKFTPNHFAFFPAVCLDIAMRLTERERLAIVDETVACFGPKARPFLFGSRVDDGRRGGDIDLLVRTAEKPSGDLFHRKIQFLAHLKSRIGDQRIDVVVAAPDDERDIVRIAKSHAVPIGE
jgi:predicted nucleotidyltransferase